MKFRKCLFICLCLPLTLMAQIGLGTVNPEGALDIFSSNKGVVFPRINLTDLNTQSPVINPNGGNIIDGTLIWNNTLDQTKTITPGLHFWNNSKWNKFAIENDNFSYDQTSNVVPYLSGNNCGALQLASNNPFTHLSKSKIVPIGLNVSDLPGVICNMNIEIKLRNRNFNEVSMYLMSPGGKVLKLTSGNGNIGANGLPGVNIPSGNNFTTVIINFNDLATTDITNFDGKYNRTDPNIVFSFRPEGNLDNNILYDFMPANIKTFADFNDTNPNGMWRLYVKDIIDSGILDDVHLNVEDVKLNISTYPGKLPDNFVLLNETMINSADANYIVAEAEYNAQATSNIIQTVITRSLTPIQVTTTSNLSNVTILSSGTNSTYNSIRWTAVSNKDVNSNLTTNTDYYYQLWRKAEVITPANLNENYTFILKTEY